MDVLRRQATLFLSGFGDIQKVRTEFNPEQARLINAHVTLCREDEVADWEALAVRFRASVPHTVTLEFGLPRRDGNLLYLPNLGPTVEFDQLRNILLSNSRSSARKHHPHITLIHPRNGVCTDAIFETVSARLKPFSYTFNEISFIRQENGGVWETVERFELLRSAATKSV